MVIEKEKNQITYDSYEEFFDDAISTCNLFARLYAHQTYYIYRGESSSKYKLVPSVLRQDGARRRLCHTVVDKTTLVSDADVDYINDEWKQILAENMILTDFYKKANNQGLILPACTQLLDMYSAIPQIHWEKSGRFVWYTDEIAQLASLAQHYGLATRMLDWSQDLLTAVYFASHGACKNIIDEKEADNDYMVIWMLNHRMISIQNHNEDKLPVKFVIPHYNANPNLNAQKGVLVYWELKIDMEKIESIPIDRTPLDEKIKDYKYRFVGFPLIYKLMIPIKECAKALSHICTLGYNSAQLFPGYHGVVQQIDDESMINMLMNTQHVRPSSRNSFVIYERRRPALVQDDQSSPET